MQTNMFNDAIEAVKSYAASQYLTPAFGGAVDDQNGNNATHPSYQQAITLQVSTYTNLPLASACQAWVHGFK